MRNFVMSYTIKIETGHINLSPYAFRRTAEDFLQCYHSFHPPKFSLVPYFLCARAIELSLKAMHLEASTQLQVKRNFGHDLKASYDALPKPKQILSSAELVVLEQASLLYDAKRFEYLQPIDAAHGYSEFPQLNEIAEIAAKLVSACA